MDVFVEYMVKKKKSTKDIVKIAAYIFAAIVITAVLFMFTIWTMGTSISKIMPFAVIFIVAIIAGAWFFAIKFIKKLSIEYEYAFTNGEFDVDAIYSKKTRSHILTVKVKEFKMCARVFDEEYKDYFIKNSDRVRVMQLGDGNLNSSTYFADFFLDGELKRMIFSPSKHLIEQMRRYNTKNIHVSE